MDRIDRIASNSYLKPITPSIRAMLGFALTASALKILRLDKKVFDFSAPKMSHAAFLGAVYGCIWSAGDWMSRQITVTHALQTEKRSQPHKVGPTTVVPRTKKKPSKKKPSKQIIRRIILPQMSRSKYPDVYKVLSIGSLVLAAYSSTHLLNCMRYSTSSRLFRLALICSLPVALLKSAQNVTHNGSLKVK